METGGSVPLKGRGTEEWTVTILRRPPRPIAVSLSISHSEVQSEQGRRRAMSAEEEVDLLQQGQHTQTNYTFGGREKRLHAGLQVNLSNEQNSSEEIWRTEARLSRICVW